MSNKKLQKPENKTTKSFNFVVLNEEGDICDHHTLSGASPEEALVKAVKVYGIESDREYHLVLTTKKYKPTFVAE